MIREGFLLRWWGRQIQAGDVEAEMNSKRELKYGSRIFQAEDLIIQTPWGEVA